MTSSENLASMDMWAPRLPFGDSWISEAYARDTETLTKALQKSLSGADPFQLAFPSACAGGGFGGGASLFDLVSSQESPTPAVSSLSGSDQEMPPPPPQQQQHPPPLPAPVKRRAGAAVAPAAGRVAKRKSRASKRTPTTFINADAANFRQMVQQVTGIRLGNGQVPVVPLLKPEPQRPGNRLQGSLPTLDTSAFLLDHHHQQQPQLQQQQQQQQVVGPTSQVAVPPLSLPPAAVVDGGSGLEFDGFFPTLESWKVL